MSEPGSTALAERPAWEYVRDAGRVIALTAYGLLASIGALFLPGLSLAAGALLAVLGGAAVAGLHRVPDLPPLPHPAVASTRMACLPAAIAGTTALGAGAGIAVGLGLAVATAFAAHWSTLPSAGSPTSAAAKSVADERSLREVLRQLPMDVLLDEWRSTPALGGPSRETPDGVRLRELLIDEMQRRDPTGTSRWLVNGFDEPPDGYVGGRAG